MGSVTFKKSEYIFRQGDEINGLYLLTKGKVEQVVDQTRLVHGPGTVLGLSDSFHTVYSGDYRALDECTATRIEFLGHGDFVSIFEAMPVYVFGFAKNAVRQCKNICDIYLDSKCLVDDFYHIATEKYREYLHLCNEKKMPYKRFTRINYITSPDFENVIEDWEYKYAFTLNDVPNANIEQIYGGEVAVAIGTIGLLCRMSDTALKGLDELGAWIDKNMDIILCDGKMDLFQLWFDMKARACVMGRSVKDIDDSIDYLLDFIQKCGIYPPELIKKKQNDYRSYNFGDTEAFDGIDTGLFIDEALSDEITSDEATFVIENEFEQLIDEEFGDIEIDNEPVNTDDDDEGEDCLETILEFSGLEEKSRTEVRKRIKTYAALPQKDAGDDRTRKLRRAIAEDFYTIYQACFFKTIDNPNVNPIIMMFMHFGFIDVTLAGQENTNEIYELLEKIPFITSDRIYTIYTWLLAIYQKDKEPSRNELDLDFKGYVQQEKRSGNIKESQVKAFLESSEERVKFEIANFFKTANRATSGRMAGFCPPLSEDDLINSPFKSILNSLIINKSLDKVRDIDFSIFFRDVRFADIDRGLKAEDLKKEILPDIILLPNAGTRGMMWQECQSPKKDTPARFVFPIFCQVDIDKLMHYVCGSFRWEICRREMGVRWNDIATKSLTSDFYDYYTFYKKNRELSAEAKEKLKNVLKKNRNNMRETFTAQYIIWVNYESSGNVRLNKVEREIFCRYVPFRKPYRQAVSGHPMFGDIVSRYENQCAQKLHHLEQLHARYEKNGGTVTEDMKTNMTYYQM